MQFSLSHFELKARDFARMEAFYTETLGFVATDRSPPGGHQMVFLSRHPNEHHQLVLGAARDGAFAAGSIDHIAFRVASLDVLRALYDTLNSRRDVALETVCHGTTWSVYLRDPENNRIEFFADTPWHVAQPVRFAIDLSLTNEELLTLTEQKISSAPNFQPIGRWQQMHHEQMKSP